MVMGTGEFELGDIFFNDEKEVNYVFHTQNCCGESGLIVFIRNL
jgi:hypothetical protein